MVVCAMWIIPCTARVSHDFFLDFPAPVSRGSTCCTSRREVGRGGALYDRDRAARAYESAYSHPSNPAHLSRLWM